ncbi:hypothetical protein FOA43_004213 [Brettanomyces nanus]|uniref:Uncharacterized protein n=1 Tax=Eeniella nana TaxID=13502 RepID=A0A875SB98_EENNA|nr:uncharacterized protein FOA43_004213 [Brettanomyces nanus]QPG76819.1 hypothetical protein FOA43_004213 [Brettanomyces nanus]
MQNPNSSPSEYKEYDGVEEVAQVAQTTSTPLLNEFTTTKYHDLDLEFEKFNGSVSDFADLPQSQVYLDDSIQTNEPGPGFDNTTISKVSEDGNDYNLENIAPGVPKLTIMKNRGDPTIDSSLITEEPSVVDFSKLNSYRRISSLLTVKKTSETETKQAVKLHQLNKSMRKLSTKIHKLEREIDVVDQLIPETYDGSALSQSLQYKKLNFARGKLEDKCEALKKKRYEMSILVNTKYKNFYGYNGADRAQYWVSNVVRD